MFLTELHLRNWRSYRNATIRFPVPSAKTNIILVGAQNGTGKTSILIALYLGLFGREAIRLIEGFRLGLKDSDINKSYKKLLERLVHRPAIKNQEDIFASVRLKIETTAGTVVVNRTWHFNRQGNVRDLNSRDGEEVRIEEENHSPKIYSTWQEANARIEELLFPYSVVPSFFFDGEQAQELVEAAGGRALLQAVNSLYGTGILEQLSQSLKHFISNERTALRRGVGEVKENELDDKRNQLEKGEEELDSVEVDLVGKRRKHEAAATEIKRLQLELTQLVGDNVNDAEEYLRNIEALKTERETARKELTSGLASLALPLAMRRNVKTVEEIVQSEQIRDRWLLLKEEAGGKADRIVEDVLPRSGISDITPRLTSQQVRQIRAELEHALESLWNPPPQGCADGYKFSFLSESDRAAILSKIQRQLTAGVPDVAEAVITWSNADSRLKETELRYERAKDIQPKLTDLKDQISGAMDRVHTISSEIAGLEIRDKALRNSIRELRAAIGQMEKKRTQADPVYEKLDVAHRVRSVVNEAKEKLIPLCKEMLEDRCTHHFRSMISGEYHGFGVRFEADEEPWLAGSNGEAVFVTSLSGAQKRAFGLAFTLAVSDMSGQQAPIVIDTPVGNMDSQYRERVLRYVAEAAPGQVIILSHDEEVSAGYYQQIKDRVIKTYLVEFEKVEEGSGISTVIEDYYFGGIRT